MIFTIILYYIQGLPIGKGNGKALTIQSDIAYILLNYKDAKMNPEQRRQVNLSFRTLASKIENLPEVKKYPDLVVSYGMGIGRMANVPWLVLYNKKVTLTTQDGIYIVYLFRGDLSGLYLTFNQGVGRTATSAPTKDKLLEVQRIAKLLRPQLSWLHEFGFNLDDNIELRDNGTTGKAYEKSTIAYKYYDQATIPDDAQIESDLKPLLKAYEQYVNKQFEIPGPLETDRTKDFSVEPEAQPAHNSLEALQEFSASINYSAAPFLTFLIDKRYQIPATPSQILEFFGSYNLGDSSRGLFVNPWMKNPYENLNSCTHTVDHFHQPRGYACWKGRDTKKGCNDLTCKYHPNGEKPNSIPCNLSREVIWVRPSIDVQEYAFGKNYLTTIKNDLLKGNRIPLHDLLAVLYNLEKSDITKEDIAKFKEEFHFIDSEVNELFSQPEVKMTPIEPTISIQLNPVYTVKEFSEETGFSEQEIEGWLKILLRKKHLILQGPPGTGKTFIARKLAKLMLSGNRGITEKVQFHPDYCYEDFIQGYFPQTGNGFEFKIRKGIFVRFCNNAESVNDPSVLIVDEINRANLSRVFGELMYLLEYREDKIPLAAGGEPFQIPNNVYIIGTMNTADRSIALVDHALRRRFGFIRLRPQYDVLERFLLKNNITPAMTNSLVSTLKEINRAIDDQNYEVGTSFFMQDASSLRENLPIIWKTEIEPYLEEFFYDQPSKVNQFTWNTLAQNQLKEWTL